MRYLWLSFSLSKNFLFLAENDSKKMFKNRQKNEPDERTEETKVLGLVC